MSKTGVDIFDMTFFLFFAWLVFFLFLRSSVFFVFDGIASSFFINIPHTLNVFNTYGLQTVVP